MIACVAAIALYCVFEVSGLTFRVTGLELTQMNMDVTAKWDAMDSEGYVVSVFDGEKEVARKKAKNEKCTIRDLEPKKTYTFEVYAKDEDGDESLKDSLEYKMKDMQNIDISSSEDATFTAKEFNLSALANGKVTFRSLNPEIATVSKHGHVEIKKAGTARITVTATATKKECKTQAVLTMTTGNKYKGDMPELTNAIANEAWKCAWPYGTAKSTYRYGGGAPNNYFKETIVRVYPDHNHWKIKQTRWGASCDVFVGTVVRGSGYDMNFPKGLNQDYSYLPKSSKFKKVSLSEIQPGDIVMYSFKGGGGHICVYVEDENGVGYIANAHYKLKTYGIIERKHVTFNPGKYKTFGVYRATGDCTTGISEGEKGESAEAVQKFLKWAGFFQGKVDGEFGEKTTEALLAFQKATGLEESGVFDTATREKAKKYNYNTIALEGEE